MSLIETTSPYDPLNGALTIDIPFEWIDEADLFVAKVGEGTALPRPAASASDTTWRFINRQRIQIVNPVAGDAYRVERKTSTEKVFAEFVPGTPIRSQDLNSNFKQTLHVVQENTGERWSRSGDTMNGNIAMSTYDANGAVIEGPYRITGLGSPVASTDAANKQFVETTANDILLQQGVAFDVLERYLGPVATLPEYRKTGDSAVDAADVPDFGTLAFHENKMWMLVTPTDTINYHARWEQVIVAQVNPISTYQTTLYPLGSESTPQLGTLTSASDADLGEAYIFNGDLFVNQNLAIDTSFNILQINGQTLKPYLSQFNEGDYKVSIDNNEFYIKKSVLDNAPFGNSLELEATLVAFSNADVAPHGWSNAEWNYNSTSEKWELTLIGDKSELDITMDNLIPEFSAGTVTTVENTSDNEPGNPTFNIRKVDTGNTSDNHYEVDIGIPLGKDGAQINGVTFDLQGIPTFQLSNGLTFAGNTSLKGPQGSIGSYVGEAAFAYKAAPNSPTNFPHGIIAGGPIEGAGRLPETYLQIILDWNETNPTNQVGFADVYQLVGRYFLWGELEDGTQGYIGSFFDIANPDYLVGPAPALSIGSVTTAPAGSAASAEFIDDLETGDGYKLNLQLEAPRISFDGHAVTSFAEGTPGETESATFTYDTSTRLHTMALNIEKAGPPTFATGSINVTSAWDNDASVTFNDAGGDLTADYTINVDLPLTDIRVDSNGTVSTYGGNEYLNGVRVTGSITDDTPGSFNVYLEKQTKAMLNPDLDGTAEGNDPTAVYKMYMDVPVFPAPQIRIYNTVEEGDTPSVQRGYMDGETWTAGVNPADLTDYNLKFTLPTKVKSGNGNPNGQTAQKDKWNVQVVAGTSEPYSYAYGMRIAINGIYSGWSAGDEYRAEITAGNWTNWLNHTRDFFNSEAVKSSLGNVYSDVTVNTATKTFTFTSTENVPFNGFVAQMHSWTYASVNAPERTQYGREALAAVSGVQDQTYYDFHNNKVYQHDGTTWVEQSGFGESIESLHWGADGQLHITHQNPAKSVSTGDLRGPGYLSGSYNTSDGKVTFTANGFQGTTDVTTGDLRGPGYTGGTYNSDDGKVTFTANGYQGSTNVVTDDLRAPGFTGGSYDPNTGVVTFTSNGVNGGTNVTTDDLRVPFVNKGALESAPSNPIRGWFYRNTTDDKMYYYSGSTWIDMGTLRGPQGTSVSSVGVTDGKLTIQVTDPFTGTTTTPVNESPVRGASIIDQPGRINAGVNGYIPLNPDTFNVGDRVLYTGDVYSGDVGTTKVAEKGDLWLKGSEGWSLVGNIAGPMGTADSYGADFALSGTWNGSWADLLSKLDFRVGTQVSGQEYTLSYQTNTSNRVTVYTDGNTNIHTTEAFGGGEFTARWTCPSSGFVRICIDSNYSEFKELTVYPTPHRVITDFDSDRFISGGDVIVEAMDENGYVTITNKNTIQVGSESGTGNYAVDKATSGQFTTIDFAGEVVLPLLTAEDVGVTFVLFNKAATAIKIRPQTEANVGVHIAGDNGHDGAHVWLSAKGLAHITYIGNIGQWGTWDAASAHWICTGQGVTAISG